MYNYVGLDFGTISFEKKGEGVRDDDLLKR